MGNPFDDPDGWLLRFLLEDEGAEPPDFQGPHREQNQNHHCSAVLATAEATPTTREVDVDVGVADPLTQELPGAATTGEAESEETPMLWPGSCSMFADVPEPSPCHVVQVTPEELRYQEAWARNREMHRLRDSTSVVTRSRSRPAPAKVGRAQRTGIHTRKAVRQRGFPEKPLTRQQIASECKDIIEIEIGATSANFKVGLTTDLETRFDYYQREGVTRMVLLYSADDPELARQLERTLIGCYINGPRCRNKAPGGEGIHTGQTPVHVYVVFGGGVPPDDPPLLSFWPRATARSRKSRPP